MLHFQAIGLQVDDIRNLLQTIKVLSLIKLIRFFL